MAHDKQFIATGAKPKGEAAVWLTSMGLAVGLVMTGVLLAVILYRGLEVFWPKRIVELTLNDGNRVVGEVVLDNTKVTEVIRKVKDPNNPEKTIERIKKKRIKERQLFVGNKDAFGESFRYVNVADIKEQAKPQDIIKIERSEHGFAMGQPKRILLDDGSTIDAKDPKFDEALRKKVNEAIRQRQAIYRIDRHTVGPIAKRMSKLRLYLRSLKRNKQGDSQEAVAYRKELAELQAKSDSYAKETAGMREDIKKAKLYVVLQDNREEVIPIGNIIRYRYPNRLSTASRITTAIANAWHFVSEDPREANMEGGVFPAIFGTFMMTIIMSLLVTPFGVIAAVYMHEYAKQGFLLRLVRIAVNNLAGVPSIVFGVFGLGFFVYFLGGTIDKIFFPEYLPENSVFGSGGMLWASLTLALLTLPVVIVASEEALSAVPRGMREASYAVGASKWQTIYRIVIPAAIPGIITGMILAMARGAGEVAPLMLVGVVKAAPDLPISASFPFGLDQKFMHLGFHIFDLGLHSPDSEAARPMVFATTVLLILLVIVMNLAGIVIRERLRKRYAAGAF